MILDISEKSVKDYGLGFSATLLKTSFRKEEEITVCSEKELL
jgi:hypothetical protein